MQSYRQTGASYPRSSGVLVLLSKKQPRMPARSSRIQPITGPGSLQELCSPVAKDTQRLLLGGNQISPHYWWQPVLGVGKDQVSQGVAADRRELMF